MKELLSSFYSRCPVISEEVSSLARKVDISGDGKSVYLPFNRNILWLRESESRIVISHGGVMIREGSTYTDYYGYLTSIESAINDAQDLCRRYDVSKSSSMLITIDVRIFETPALADETKEGIFWNEKDIKRRRYLNPPRDWIYYDKEKVDSLESAIDSESKLHAWQNIETVAERSVVKSDSLWMVGNGRPLLSETPAPVKNFIEKHQSLLPADR